jgi:hypothetical protein
VGTTDTGSGPVVGFAVISTILNFQVLPLES